MKRSTGKMVSMILSVTLVFALVLGGFGILGFNGDPSVSVLAVGSDGSSSGGSGSGSSSSSSSSSSYSSSAKKSTVKKAKLKASGKTATVVAGKKTTLGRTKILTLKNAGGKKTYKIVKVSKSKKYFKINKKNGKLTIKAGLKAGTYKLKIRVKTTGSKKYKAGTKTVTVKIKVQNPAPAVTPAPAPVTPVTPDPATPETPETPDPGTQTGN